MARATCVAKSSQSCRAISLDRFSFGTTTSQNRFHASRSIRFLLITRFSPMSLRLPFPTSGTSSPSSSSSPALSGCKTVQTKVARLESETARASEAGFREDWTRRWSDEMISVKSGKAGVNSGKMYAERRAFICLGQLSGERANGHLLNMEWDVNLHCRPCQIFLQSSSPFLDL